jgi:hypothetical protein
LCREINDFKKFYHPRNECSKEYDLFTDSNSVLAIWKNNFSQLLNIHGVSDVKQTKFFTAEPLEPELSAFKVDVTIEN